MEEGQLWFNEVELGIWKTDEIFRSLGRVSIGDMNVLFTSKVVEPILVETRTSVFLLFALCMFKKLSRGAGVLGGFGPERQGRTLSVSRFVIKASRNTSSDLRMKGIKKQINSNFNT